MDRDRRHVLLTRRCAWCKRIDCDSSWREERRADPGPTSDTICPACLARLTPSAPAAGR